MKYFAVLATALALAGCGASPEEERASIERAQHQLPEGCVLIYAGEVEITGSVHPSRIFGVKCGNTVTTTVNTVVPEGKSSRNQADVVVTQN